MRYSLKAICIATLLFFVSAAAQAQKLVRYTIFVHQDFLSKDHLTLAMNQIPNKGVYIKEHAFEVVLEQENAGDYVRSLFESAGIPVLSVSDSKFQGIHSYEKAGGADCESAALLCSNTSQTANSNGAGIQELTGSNRGCLSSENQSSWYYLNVQSGGTLTMTISPANSNDDYDFAIWGPFTSANAGANCPPTSGPIRCSWSAVKGNTGMVIPYNGQTSSSGCGPWYWPFDPCYGMITTTNNPADLSEGSGGDSWVSHLSTSANQIYILLVDNYSNSGQPYSMSFGGTSVLGCTPAVLPIELTTFYAKKTTKGNVLNWATQSEDRSNYFTVEWTTNLVSDDWKEIAHIPAQGYSEEMVYYNVLHSNASSTEINYYRLNSTDLDGSRKVHDSHIVSVDNSQEAKKVEKILNLMGQEVNENWQGVVIYYYSDGSTEKVYR